MSNEIGEQIVGRWKAADPKNQDAYVEFSPQNLWFASDGCNTASGSWQLQPDGEFSVGGGGGMTQVGCNNEPIPEAVWNAISVAIGDDDDLMLTSAEGDKTILFRSSEDAMTITGDWVGPASSTAVSLVKFNDDGTWSGSAGCQEYQSTWELKFTDESQDVAIIDSLGSTGVMPMAPGSAILVIGPEPLEKLAECTDAGQPAFPLAYGSEHWFGLSPSTFSVLPVTTEPTDGNWLSFFPRANTPHDQH